MAQDIALRPRIYTKEETAQLSAATLAYIGDAVYELAVRAELLSSLRLPSGALHGRAAGIVNAGAQSEAAQRLTEGLSDEELRVYLRGRNAKLTAGKKHHPAEHCRATGLETLFGYLYLTGQDERLGELIGSVLLLLLPKDG